MKVPIKLIKMFQTFAFSVGVLLCGVGYALYKKVIQMLKDIDEKYEGKLKTLVFELKVKHQVSINQLLKDIDSKYELKVNHQESIQKLENTIEYNLEHTETLAIDLNNKLRLLKDELKQDLVLLEDKVKDELKEDLLDKVKEDLVVSEDKMKNKLKSELKNIDKLNEFENALSYCGVGNSACHMPRYFNHHYGKKNFSVLSNDTYTCSWSENMIRCFNSTERLKQLNRSEFYVKCEIHTKEYNKTHGCFCQCGNQTPCERITSQLYDASIIEINSKKYILSKFICSSIITDPNADRVVYNMKKALLFNYEPDFKPKLEDKTTTYKWYQVGSIDRITKEIIWEPK